MVIQYFIIGYIILFIIIDDKFKFESVFNGDNMFYLSPTFKDYLSFFATDEKTEDATPKKLDDMRKEGQVPKSTELNSAITLLAIVLAMMFFGDFILNTLSESMKFFFNNLSTYNLDTETDTLYLMRRSFYVIGVCSAVVLLPVGLFAIISNLGQIGFLFTFKAIKPKVSKLNPINGFKNIFSTKSLFELAKNLAKLILFASIIYFYFSGQINELFKVTDFQAQQILPFTSNLFMGLMFRIIFFLIIVAIIDLIYQRRNFQKQARMTKQEVKEEQKQAYGDPRTKARQRSEQRRFSMNRMMASVPDATVVITNPTHYAVAIQFDFESDDVPKVVAKGQDFIAQKIKEVAGEHDVPIIENKPLARALYAKAEIESYIPVELYASIAEILAAIYKLNNKRK